MEETITMHLLAFFDSIFYYFKLLFWASASPTLNSGIKRQYEKCPCPPPFNTMALYSNLKWLAVYSYASWISGILINYIYKLIIPYPQVPLANNAPDCKLPYGTN